MLAKIIAQLYRHIPNDPEQRFRSRLMLGILATLIVANIIVLIFFIFLAPAQMDANAIRLAIISTAIAGTINVFALLMLLRGHQLLAASMVVGIETSAMWVTVWFTNGVPNSPALPLLLAPVIFAFCLLGPRRGMLLAAATITYLIALWYGATYLDWRLPAMQSRRNPAFDSAVIAGFNAIVVLAVLWVYEVITTRLRDQLTLLAGHDELTGAANRREFLSRLAQSCARCNRNNLQLAVFYIDLNGFKQINDQRGHQIGDEVLKTIAARLRHSLRLQDVIARLGGDEFAIITEPRAGGDSIAVIERKLRQTIGEPIVLGAQSFAVSASIGIALYPQHGVQPEELLRYADTVMYGEKRQRVPHDA